MAKTCEHNFYCINCGNKSLTLPRKRGHFHKKNHRKRLYCFHCKTEVNMVECQNYEDELNFKEDFANGLFQEEAKESLKFIEEEQNENKTLDTLRAARFR